MSTTWRPHPIVRPVAIGVVRRGDQLLVVAVCDDAGAIKGWRPLGGTIELGERAAEALRREFVEELGEAITEPRISTSTTARADTRSCSCSTRPSPVPTPHCDTIASWTLSNYACPSVVV
jgi:8-oxo-dGTP pyrophosphatase MutT (NUDIX family)